MLGWEDADNSFYLMKSNIIKLVIELFIFVRMLPTEGKGANRSAIRKVENKQSYVSDRK